MFQLDHVFHVFTMWPHCVKGRNFVNENEEDANEVTQGAENDNERRRFRLPERRHSPLGPQLLSLKQS